MPGALVNGAGTGDFTDLGSDASLDNLATFTWLVWLFRTSANNNQHVYSKDGISPFGPSLVFVTSPGTCEMRMFYGYGTTAANAVAVTGTSTINRWECYAATFLADVPRIYMGTLTTPMAEVSYVGGAPTTGVGGRRDDSAQNLYAGNLPRSTTLPFIGSLGFSGFYGAVLNTTEMDSWRKRPRKTVGSNTALRFLRYGKNGADAIEYGGLANGAVTGATQGNGVPLLQTLPSMMGRAA